MVLILILSQSVAAYGENELILDQNSITYNGNEKKDIGGNAIEEYGIYVFTQDMDQQVMEKIKREEESLAEMENHLFLQEGNKEIEDYSDLFMNENLGHVELERQTKDVSKEREETINGIKIFMGVTALIGVTILITVEIIIWRRKKYGYYHNH